MDKRRKNSPLIKVKDAILVRTDKLSKKEVLYKMSKYIDKVIQIYLISSLVGSSIGSVVGFNSIPAGVIV